MGVVIRHKSDSLQGQDSTWPGRECRGAEFYSKCSRKPGPSKVMNYLSRTLTIHYLVPMHSP